MLALSEEDGSNRHGSGQSMQTFQARANAPAQQSPSLSRPAATHSQSRVLGELSSQAYRRSTPRGLSGMKIAGSGRGSQLEPTAGQSSAQRATLQAKALPGRLSLSAQEPITVEDDDEDSRSQAFTASPAKRDAFTSATPRSSDAASLSSGHDADESNDPIDMLHHRQSARGYDWPKSSPTRMDSNGSPREATPHPFELVDDSSDETSPQAGLKGKKVASVSPFDSRGEPSRKKRRCDDAPPPRQHDEPLPFKQSFKQSRVMVPSTASPSSREAEGDGDDERDDGDDDISYQGTNRGTSIAGVASGRGRSGGLGHDLMQLNGGRGAATAISAKRQQDRDNQVVAAAKGDVRWYDIKGAGQRSGVKASDSPVTSMARAESANGTRSAAPERTLDSYEFDHLLLGEQYIAGPHQLFCDVRPDRFQLKIRKTQTTDEETLINIQFEDIGLFTCPRKGAIGQFFKFQLKGDSCAITLLEGLSLEKRFDAKSLEASAIVGMMKDKDASAFTSSWENLCAKLKKKRPKFPPEFLDQPALDALLHNLRGRLPTGASPQIPVSTTKRANPIARIPVPITAPISSSSFHGHKPVDAFSNLMDRAQAPGSGHRADAPLPNIPRKASAPEMPRKATPSLLALSGTRPQTRQQTRREGTDDVHQDLEDSRRKAVSEAAVRQKTAPKDDVQILRWPIRGGPGAISIFRSDLEKLDEGEFLNDTLVEFGLKYTLDQLRDRGQAESQALADAMYLYSSFFFKRLTESRDIAKGYENVRKWTSKVDIFQKEFLVVPINEHLHWYLAIIVRPRLIFTRQKEEKKKGKAPASVRRSARHNMIVQDSAEEDGPEAIQTHAEQPRPARQRRIVHSSDGDSQRDSSGLSSAESEEPPMVQMGEDEQKVMMPDDPLAAEAEDGDAGTDSQIDQLDSSHDALGDTDDEHQAGGTVSHQGLLSSGTHPGVTEWVAKGQNPADQSAASASSAAGPQILPPQMSTPPHNTYRRGQTLLGQGSSTPRGDVVPPTPSGSSQTAPDQSGAADQGGADDESAEDQVLIVPSTISMDPQDQDGPVTDINGQLERMGVDSAYQHVQEDNDPMDIDEVEEEEFSIQETRFSNSGAGPSRHGANFDSSSCIDNPGRGQLVGGSGSPASTSGRVPLTIKPGEGRQRNGQPQPQALSLRERLQMPPAQDDDFQVVDRTVKLIPPSQQNQESSGPSRPRARPLGAAATSSRADSSTTWQRSQPATKTRAYDPEVPTIIFFDSLSNSHRPAGTSLTKYLKMEALHKRPEELAKLGLELPADEAEARKKVLEELTDCNVVNAIVPEQPNSCDCGVYLLHFFRQFFSDPVRFLELIEDQHKNAIPYRVGNVSSLWKGEDGPKQRAFWRGAIKDNTAAWEEVRKKDEEQRAEERKKRLAERAAAESAEGSPAPGASTPTNPEDTSTGQRGSASASATANLNATDVAMLEPRLRPRNSAGANTSTASTLSQAGKSVATRSAPARGSARKSAAAGRKGEEGTNANNAIALSDSE
ncbi:hypothetical protein OC844_006719 [Tilletia horrida]|nr:hypothetical protein OC844_006719 [Tilletia horrida]